MITKTEIRATTLGKTIARYDNEDDGRLIATAPELLEALKVVNAWFWNEPFDTTRWPAEQINAAIAHAKGK